MDRFTSQRSIVARTCQQSIAERRLLVREFAMAVDSTKAAVFFPCLGSTVLFGNTLATRPGWRLCTHARYGIQKCAHDHETNLGDLSGIGDVPI